MLTPVEKPPSPGPPHRAQLPEPVERRLANGLRVIAFQLRSAPKALSVPIVAAKLVIPGGSIAESEDDAGLSALMASLLTQGTTRRNAVELAQALDGMGTRIKAMSSYDAMVMSVSALTDVFPKAFALFDEIVREPAFEEHELERWRAKAISDLAFANSNPSSLARLVAKRVAYGSPYGHAASGTAETLASLDRAKVVELHRRFIRPDHATLIVGGDIAPADAFALVERQFGAWRAPDEPIPQLAPFTAPAPRRHVVVVDKPEAGRTAIIIGRQSIRYDSPEYVPGVVTTAVLSGYSGRLNQEVRVKRGLSYGAGATLNARAHPGLFFASTLVDHARVAEAVDVIFTTLEGVRAAPIDPAELAVRKMTVTGSFSRSVETIEGIAGLISELALYDVPIESIATYAQRVEAVGVDDVHAFAAAHLTPDLFTVLVGDAKQFRDTLPTSLGDITVIPFADLDLGRPDLTR